MQDHMVTFLGFVPGLLQELARGWGTVSQSGIQPQMVPQIQITHVRVGGLGT